MKIDEYLKIDWKAVEDLDYDLELVCEGLYKLKPSWYLGAVPYDKNMNGAYSNEFTQSFLSDRPTQSHPFPHFKS